MAAVSAGKVLMLFRGNYSPTAEYKVLDVVEHNNTRWIAKKTTTGVEPAEGDNWTSWLNIDTALSDTSTNVVQNKVIKAELDKKINKNQGSANKGKALVVGSDGNITLGQGVEIATSFGETTSDTKVPSEKLVKTNLDTVGTQISNVMGSDAYNPAKTYQVGDTCIDENTLWEKIGTAEAGVKPVEGTKWKKLSLSSLNSNFTKQGTTKILYESNGSAVSNKSVTVDDLKEFKYIAVSVLGINDATLANNIIPYEIFSTFKTSGFHAAVYSNTESSGVRYVSDTSILVRQIGNFGTLVYGIY